MGELSTVFVLGALAVYVVALVCFAVDISALGGHAPKRTVRRAANIGLALSWLGLVLQGVGLVLRGLSAGRVPWANMYEFSLTFTFAAMATFLLIQRKRDIRYLGVFVTFVVVSVLFFAFWQLYVEADGVQPILDSYWLAIHVSVAATSTGLFSVAAGGSVLQLVQHHQTAKAETREPALVGSGASAEAMADAGSASSTAKPRSGPATFTGRLMAQLPDEQTLERFAYRLNAVAFVGWTLTVVAGAIWAEAAWGRPWGWDPKETWSLVIWLIYAAYLHVRATVGWAINRFAWFALVGFVALLANFYVVNIFFAGKHSYSGL
jgi:cytochrome c-type biogenesis protein CcsB